MRLAISQCIWRAVILALVSTSCGVVAAEDIYFVKPVGDLTIVDGKLPSAVELDRSWAIGLNDNSQALARVVLDGPGEAYVVHHREGTGSEPFYSRLQLAVRAPAGKAVTGQLYLSTIVLRREGQYGYDRKYEIVRFSLDPTDSKAESARQYLICKAVYYDQLLERDIPGAAWFRFQAEAAMRELGKEGDAEQRRVRNRLGTNRPRVDDVGGTFSLATGGQAIAENLQLDRVLPPGERQVADIDVASIKGITVREFDWTKYVQDKKPQLDPLASIIPADQHAVFFPSFAALLEVADNADRFGTPVIRAAEPRSEDASTRRRYETQLCLPATALSRLLGPHVIESVAITGGDPYLRSGSDVAILFQAKQLAVLSSLIAARVALAGNENSTATDVSGDVDGVTYRGMRSPDRKVCSYVATLGDTVVVTNSLVQLGRLVATHKKKAPAISSLPEYAFFRDRYPRGATNESGLLIISDATIRRWCGPMSRIADSRRVRAAAVMSDLQARHLKHVVEKLDQTLTAVSDYPLIEPGEMHVTANGVRSSTYGSLEFMTPIAELDVTRVTAQESQLYGRWRDGYQSNWSNFFDPIAVKFFVGPKQVAADVTVMPLIDASQYNRISQYARGAKLKQSAGDRHPEAILHWSMALNANSEVVRRDAQSLVQLAPGLKVNPLDWIDSSISAYADRDDFWAELAKRAASSGPNDFDYDYFMQNFQRIPIALHVDVKDSLKLAAFLTLARGYIDTAAPGLTHWEVKQHRDTPYVHIGSQMGNLGLSYCAGQEDFTLSPHEGLIQRAIDRQLARQEAKKAATNGEAAKEAAKTESERAKRDSTVASSATTIAGVDKPWLGEHWCLRVDGSAIALVDGIFARDQQQLMQRLAWASLPILNEWRRLYPGEDPVVLHERLWHRRLVCPGGGEYRWNDKWQTMESTVYGHPAEPRIGPTVAAGLRDLTSGDFGLTFEEQGLRARAELTRSAENGK